MPGESHTLGRADYRARPLTDEPAAQAHARLERLFALLHDCRSEPLLLPRSRRVDSVRAHVGRGDRQRFAKGYMTLSKSVLSSSVRWTW
jgi:hypothetical protein